MPNRETRRKLDLDERRNGHEREIVEVRFLGQDWELPKAPTLAAITAFEQTEIGGAVRALFGEEQGARFLAAGADTDDLNALFEAVYGDDLGESSASSDS